MSLQKTACQIALFVCAALTGVKCYNETIPTSCGDLALPNLMCCMCDNDTNAWYENTFTDTERFDSNSSWRFESNVRSWDSICRWGFGVATCMATKVPQCNNANIGVEILEKAESYYLGFYQPPVGVCGQCGGESGRQNWERLVNFYRRVCDGQQVKASVKQVISDPDFDTSTQCMDGPVRRDMYRCYTVLLDEFFAAGGAVDVGNQSSINSLNRLAESVLDCMFGLLNRSPCNAATRRVMYQVTRLQAPAFILYDNLKINEASTEDFRSKLRCTVGVYGDPHIKTCWSQSLVTCSAPGQQTYLSNAYMVIKGENREIGRVASPNATSLRSVEIRFNSIAGDKLMATYTVSEGILKTTFDNNGDTVAGSDSDRVELHVDPDNRIRFVQNGTGAVLILRQWDGNYFFTLRMAMNVVLGSRGLLIEGCPPDQVVTTDVFLRRSRRQATESDCTIGCVSATTENVNYLPACLIDCLATEDLQFATNMTSGALEDEALAVTFDVSLREGAYQPAYVHVDNDNKGGKNLASSPAVQVSIILATGVLLHALLNPLQM